MPSETDGFGTRTEAAVAPSAGAGGGGAAGGRNWERTLLLLGGGSCVIAGFFCVLDLLRLAKFKPPTLFLDCALTFLCCASLAAELRLGVGYVLLKWVYFLTTHTGRGLFYIFLASTFLNPDETLNMIVAVLLVAAGGAYFCISTALRAQGSLRPYEDASIERKEAARLAAAGGGRRPPAAAAAAADGPESTRGLTGTPPPDDPPGRDVNPFAYAANTQQPAYRDGPPAAGTATAYDRPTHVFDRPEQPVDLHAERAPRAPHALLGLADDDAAKGSPPAGGGGTDDQLERMYAQMRGPGDREL